MRRRRYRIEYENAEGGFVIVGKPFRFYRSAMRRKRTIEAENPGVFYRIVRHVNFEATT